LTGLTPALSGSAPGLPCGSPLGGRWRVIPCLSSSAAVVVVAGHPGDLPARRGAWFAQLMPAQRCAGRHVAAQQRVVVAVLGALLAVIPSAAAFGALLCFVAIIPAVVSFRRVRRGTATNRRRSVAALVLAPVFFIVALSVGAATSPPLPTSSHAGTPPPLTNQASTPALQQSPAAIASAPGPTVAPGQGLLAAEPAPAVASAVAKAPVAVAPAPARAPVAAPPSARSPAPVAAPPPPPAGPAGGTSCDEGTHYINSSGACVPRPTVAAAPPPGATAKCVDGQYSFSQHHQGTCSGHGGVAQYL
jgi:hypothetical protein